MPDAIPHLPALRWGDEYRSLATNELRDHRTGAVVGVLSQVNAGLVRRDLRRAPGAGVELRSLSVREIVARCGTAAELFETGDLPLADGVTQSPARYREQLAATAALPHTLARENQAKLSSVLRELPTILRGLTRGLSLEALDSAISDHDGIPLWLVPQCAALGAVLPSNSPGVNALWLPALAMRVPVLLKPGNADPWTPLRLARALIAAGLPQEALGILPTDHEGAAAVLEGCGRALLFGDARTTAPWSARASIEIHGPGRSKVWIGSDEVDRWEAHLEVLVDSIARNGGRSCINASAIVVPRHADAIAAALAERLAALRARPLDDPEARLAGFSDAALAERIDGAIEDALRASGAEDVSTRFRGGPRRVEAGGTIFLEPTVVRCTALDHPLANTEYLFPFASVVEVADADALEWMGDTLVLTAITRDPANLARVTRSTRVGRLNLGPIPTPTVRWDQPHEGNLFDFLYTRRAIGRAGGW